MSSDVSTEDDWPTGDRLSVAGAEELAATVVRYEDEPAECTIYPAAASDEDLMTRWVTAREGSFVALPDCR